MKQPDIRIKRAYIPAEPTDGSRFLIDRLWPRGIKKDGLPLVAWLKDLAPSTALRKQFGHDPKRWKDFQRAYEKELTSAQARERIDFLIRLARTRTITLIYSARDEEHNDAVVLKKVLERAIASRPRPTPRKAA